MYLQSYSAPSQKAVAQTYEVSAGKPVTHPANTDRAWVTVHNSSGAAGGTLNVGLVAEVAAWRLAPGESVTLPSPVFLGQIFLSAGAKASATVTEMIKFDA